VFRAGHLFGTAKGIKCRFHMNSITPGISFY
jgi:hypothetical protein